MQSWFCGKVNIRALLLIVVDQNHMDNFYMKNVEAKASP